MLNNRFHEIFGPVPILGMIHLAGEKPHIRAMDEIGIYEEEGVDGAIIENYHGSMDDIVNTLEAVSRANPQMAIGVNILPNTVTRAMHLANAYNATFIQLDHVAGTYVRGEIVASVYTKAKAEHPDLIIMGGVWPKYYTPVKDSDLKDDLITGMERAEAIVVTGDGTGKETPMPTARQSTAARRR